MYNILNNENWKIFQYSIDHNKIVHYSFDFWNTIAHSNPDFKQKRAEYIASLSNGMLSSEVVTHTFKIVGDEYNKKIESGGSIDSSIDLLQMVLKKLFFKPTIDASIILESINNFFLAYQPTIDKDFLICIKNIKAAGKTSSLTSNTAFISGGLIRKFLSNSNLSDLFEFTLFSDEIGYGKPNAKIFDKLIYNSANYHPGILPSQIIHIGDNYIADYLGALINNIMPYDITNYNY